MAQASIVGIVDTEAEPPPATAAQGAKTLVPVNVDANDLASMEDSMYNSASSSSCSSSSSKDPPNSASTAPPEDMETEPPEAKLDPVAEDGAMMDSTTAPLQSVEDHQQTLGDAPHRHPKKSTKLGPALADPGGWV